MSAKPIHPVLTEFWIPAIVSTLAAMILAGALMFCDYILYLYPQSEVINLLFARILNGTLHFVLSEQVTDCYQNINIIVTLLIWFAEWLHLPPYSTLWLWQSAFNTLLIFRAARWLRQENKTTFSLTAYLLFFGNPLLWYSMFFMPSQVILAWLVIEWLLQKNASNPVSYFILLAISFCGSMGFIASIVIAIATTIHSVWHAKKTESVFLLSWIAVLPAVLFYLIQSINAQTLGGGYLVSMPSPLIAWGTFPWLSFQAHENLRHFLVWMGNGGAQWWVPLPLFGMVVLAGLIQQYQSGWIPIAFLFTLLSLLASFFFIVPLDTLHHTQYALVLLILLIPYAAQGLLLLAYSLPSLRHEAAGAAALLILFLGWFDQPTVWQRSISQAKLLQDISQNIHTILDTQTRNKNQTVAIPFHPTLYANLPQDQTVIPLNLAIQNEIPLMRQSLNGIRVTAIQAFQLCPEIIFELPKELWHHDQTPLSFSLISPIQNLLLGNYDTYKQQQITYYQKQSRPIPEQPIQELLRPSFSSWTLTKSDKKGLIIQRIPLPEDPDRMTWEFETAYSHTESVGFAFGSFPNRSLSVVGSGAAVSGTGANQRFMGTLQSEPFIIQGDDLHFFANMPKDASPTVFCLAVKQKIADRNPSNPPSVKHIFDHLPNEPLVGETKFYLKPEELHYEQDGIYGWQVARVLHGGETSGWQQISWSMAPWKNKQAVWLAADRDRQSWMAIDHIIQTDRPPGYYWNFENGTYEGWITEGEAFGTQPSFRSIGEQLPVTGFEGNYFINSYFDGKDRYLGTLISPEFTLDFNHMDFLIGGGSDQNTVYVSLKINGQTVFRETGDQSETLRRVEWDLTPWLGQTARITVADYAAGAWGHILADDFRIYDK